jgi:hypothetical protein
MVPLKYKVIIKDLAPNYRVYEQLKETSHYTYYCTGTPSPSSTKETFSWRPHAPSRAN